MSHQVDRDRWQQMSILEQMGNIYSEVGRAYKAKRNNQPERLEPAVARALDLFDATVEGLVEQQSHRTKEVLRAKDQFLRTFYGELDNEDERQKLDDYFLHYAIAARRNR